jgi:hypothetical protein
MVIGRYSSWKVALTLALLVWGIAVGGGFCWGERQLGDALTCIRIKFFLEFAPG